MRFRVVVSATFVLAAGAVSFAGCGIPAQSNVELARVNGGGGGSGGGSAGGSQAGAAGTVAGGKAGSSAAGKGGGVTGSPCKTPTDCDDGNDCTAESCLATGCSYSPLVPGAACDTNRDKCDGVGNCQGTKCVIDEATKVDPTDADPCTDNVCDPATGKISNPLKVKPSDSTLCTLAYCDPATGMATTRNLAIDNDPCTFDECDLSIGPINTLKPTGDGNACTTDSCNAATGKIDHEPIVGCVGCDLKQTPAEQAKACNDGNPCTIDSCIEVSGVATCDSTQVPNGTEIDKDGTRCNGTETCVNGKVKNLDVKVVDDGLACTADSCDPVTGEVKNIAKSGCLDCKKVEDCPNLGLECQSYTCEKGECVRHYATGGGCSDGLACTTNDLCLVGLCVGAKVTANDNDACTTNDKCNEPDGTITGTPLGGGCLSCKGTDTSTCGDQTTGGLDKECVVPKCSGGKCDRTFEPASKACGAAAGNNCEDRGHCDGVGKCTGPIQKTNCCLTSGDCEAPAACQLPATCGTDNRCSAGGPVSCADPTCDPADGQKVVTAKCTGTPGSCGTTSTPCQNGKVCKDGGCVNCTAGSDPRCKSGTCKKTGGACCLEIKKCGLVQDCSASVSDGCLPCKCEGGESCQPVLASGGAGGAAGNSGGPSAINVCRLLARPASHTPKQSAHRQVP